MSSNYLGLKLLTCLCISGPKSDICLPGILYIADAYVSVL